MLKDVKKNVLMEIITFIVVSELKKELLISNKAKILVRIGYPCNFRAELACTSNMFVPKYVTQFHRKCKV